MDAGAHPGGDGRGRRARRSPPGTPVDVLMERAGRAVAWTVRRALRGTYGRRVVLVCGKGNNGGDGLVAARVLASWGVRASVFELAERASIAVGVARALAGADVVVDAMYGTGFRGTLDGDAAWVVDQLDRLRSVQVVAVDIPSGVDGLTGTVWGPVVRATRTVTFAARKPGSGVRARSRARGRGRRRRHRHRRRVDGGGPDDHTAIGLVDDADVARGCRRARPTPTSGSRG